MADKYIYAVARIRSLELALFSNATLEQLMNCKTYQEALQFLVEKGWGDSDTPMTAEAILGCEEEKMWHTIKGMIKDMSVFDVLSYPNLYHNLKAAIKCAVLGEGTAKFFYDDTAISGKTMTAYIKEKDFGAFPKEMQAVAKEAYEAFVETGDGQLCDIIIDRATLEAIYAAGKKAKDQILKDYAESIVAVANIKIAVRAQKTAKSLEFMKRAMAPCDSLDIDRLAKAALGDVEDIRKYLEGTTYAGGAEALGVSASAFERWCDNRIIETIKPQKYASFGIGPVVAYVLARQNEIKSVRIVLSGILNGLSRESIGERVREMYV